MKYTHVRRSLLLCAAHVLLCAGGVIVPLSAWSQDEDPAPIIPAGDVPAADQPEQPEPEPEAAQEPVLTEKESAYKEIELLTEVLLHVRRKYVEEKDYKKIVNGALQGMLGSLDPHSAFLDREAYQGMQDETSGKFSGIGVTVGLRDGILTVIAPIEDTPGYRAGLQSGDQIVAVDGQKTLGMSVRDAVRKLRGDKGSKVVVTVRRASEEAPREVEIVRDNIEVASVKGARLLANGVGYARITQFSEPTAGELRKAVETLRGEGMNALVLDLRSNPGGLLSSAIEVSQQFLKQGELIVTTRGRPRVYGEIKNTAGGDRRDIDFPMAVLVNGGTASAAEIVAGALQDNRRAVVLGDTTFGKGSVQSIIPLQSDPTAALRLTVALYYTPSGRQIHDKGIEPDIPVYVTGDEWQRVQLWRARVENPAAFTADELRSVTNVVNRPLQRAVDLLQAVKILKK